MSNLNKKIIEIALSEYGITEIKGKKHNSQIIKYFQEIGFLSIKDDETAWCAAFVNWVLQKAGQKHSSKLSARSLSTIGEKVTTPQIGDICVFWRSSPTSWKGHVGFYINEDKEYIYVLGGNQSNQVNISKYSKKRLIDIRRVKGFAKDPTCQTKKQKVVEELINSANEKVPRILLRLVYLGVRRSKQFDDKIKNTVQKQLQLRFKIEESQKLPKAYDIEWLYREHNLDTAAELGETKGLNQKGITIFIGKSSSNLNGFALKSSNSVFVDYDSKSKYSSTIAHEIGHILGLNHTFEMTKKERETLGIIGEQETFNLMNYNVYTDVLTKEQINIIHNNAIIKFGKKT